MKKIRLLFVCLGNICRSPAAEGIMKSLIHQNGLQHFIECDSAGTSGYHQGEPADVRMIQFAKERGYELTGEARQIVAPDDFVNFDFIFTMDQLNHRNVLALDQENLYHHKVIPMVQHCRVHQVKEVPDPYHKGDQGFQLVLDILEDACGEFLNDLKKQVKTNET